MKVLESIKLEVERIMKLKLQKVKAQAQTKPSTPSNQSSKRKNWTRKESSTLTLNSDQLCTPETETARPKIKDSTLSSSGIQKNFPRMALYRPINSFQQTSLLSTETSIGGEIITQGRGMVQFMMKLKSSEGNIQILPIPSNLNTL